MTQNKLNTNVYKPTNFIVKIETPNYYENQELFFIVHN